MSHFPGEKYTVHLEINAQAPISWMGHGFSMTALDEKNRSAGTFSGQSVSLRQSEQYVGQLRPPSTGEWTFRPHQRV